MTATTAYTKNLALLTNHLHDAMIDPIYVDCKKPFLNVKKYNLETCDLEYLAWMGYIEDEIQCEFTHQGIAYLLQHTLKGKSGYSIIVEDVMFNHTGIGFDGYITLSTKYLFLRKYFNDNNLSWHSTPQHQHIMSSAPKPAVSVGMYYFLIDFSVVFTCQLIHKILSELRYKYITLKDDIRFIYLEKLIDSLGNYLFVSVVFDDYYQYVLDSDELHLSMKSLLNLRVRKHINNCISNKILVIE